MHQERMGGTLEAQAREHAGGGTPAWMKIDADGVYESTETLLNSQRQSGTPSSKKTPGGERRQSSDLGCFGLAR